MTTLSSGSRYLDDDDDGYGPGLRREAARLARRTLLRRLRLAWLVLVLLASLAGVVSAALLHAAGHVVPGVTAAVLACLGLLQLFASAAQSD